MYDTISRKRRYRGPCLDVALTERFPLQEPCVKQCTDQWTRTLITDALLRRIPYVRKVSSDSRGSIKKGGYPGDKVTPGLCPIL